MSHFWHQVLQSLLSAFQALREAGHLPLLDVATGTAELSGACSYLVNLTSGERAADPDCLPRMLLPPEQPRPSRFHGVEHRGPSPLFIRVNGELLCCAPRACRS